MRRKEKKVRVPITEENVKKALAEALFDSGKQLEDYPVGEIGNGLYQIAPGLIVTKKGWDFFNTIQNET